MIIEHCDNLMKKMQSDGKWYAHEVCYREKAIKPEQAFIAGFCDACSLIQRYVKQYHLDKPQNKCYTPRKAHHNK